MEDLAVRISPLQSIVQRIVGQLGQGLSTIVLIAGGKSLHIRALTRSIARLTVVIREWLAINYRQNTQLKSVRLSKVRHLRMLGRLGHYTQCGIQTEPTKGNDLRIGINSGGLLLLKEISLPVKYVATSVRVARNSTQTISGLSQNILNCVLNFLMVDSCVKLAIGHHQIMLERNGWIENTPVINKAVTEKVAV